MVDEMLKPSQFVSDAGTQFEASLKGQFYYENRHLL